MFQSRNHQTDTNRHCPGSAFARTEQHWAALCTELRAVAKNSSQLLMPYMQSWNGGCMRPYAAVLCRRIQDEFCRNILMEKHTTTFCGEFVHNLQCPPPSRIGYNCGTVSHPWYGHTAMHNNSSSLLEASFEMWFQNEILPTTKTSSIFFSRSSATWEPSDANEIQARALHLFFTPHVSSQKTESLKVVCDNNAA